jgi:hypothetical protein
MINDKSAETQDDLERIKSVILRTLEGRGKKARFVTELSAALTRAALAQDGLEPALAELTAAGVIMVRDHFCADPHLGGVDLRIAVWVQRGVGMDPQMSAIRAIDEAWDQWLAEYLANHRCT